MTDICFSYSATNTYNTCPVQFKSINWLKEFRSDSNAAAERGSIMHEKLEHAINDDTDWMEDYEWILRDFREETGLKVAEMKLAIDRHWAPTPYNLGYDDDGKEIKNPDAFYRGIIDMTVLNGTHAVVTDLKTGKQRFKECPPYETWLIDRHTEGMRYAPKILANARQANDYALLTFHHLPSIKTMDFKFVWSDVEGVAYDVFEFDRLRDNDNMHETIMATPRKIIHDINHDSWEPNPSGLCRKWCSVLSCPYNGKSFSEITRMRKPE